MTLQELIQAIDALPPDEYQQVRQHLATRPTPPALTTPPLQLSPEEWVARFTAAMSELREGMSDEQLAAFVEAANEEYIEPFDEAEWRD